MQQHISLKPLKLVTDKSEAYLTISEATYLKNYRISFNKNQLKDGLDGGNYGVGTGYNATLRLPDIQGLPEGINVAIGAKNAIETNELYLFYWNSNQYHSIFVIQGDSLEVNIVAMGSYLNFSLDPRHRLADHRVLLRVFYTSPEQGSERMIKEKCLLYTDGNSWQRWINVRAAVATAGFDGQEFPYFKLHAPHYDRQELIDYAVRPPVLPPAIHPVAAQAADYGKVNNFVDKSIQLAYVYILFDGRSTTLSPYSTPYHYSRGACNVNDAGGVRCLDVELYAGSALVEKIQLLQRTCGGAWKLYDTIYKFNQQQNDPQVIGDQYWKRSHPWADFGYNEAKNTLTYRYCGDKECGIYSADDARRFQSDLPILSNAMTAAGDSVLLGNNKYFYDNFDSSLLNQITIAVDQDPARAIVVPKMVNIKVYAYMSRADVNNQFIWKKTADSTDIRFGSLYTGQNDEVLVVPDEDDVTFNLQLGEKEGFICYLAGTSHYAIGKQYLVNNGHKTLLGVVDLSNNSQYQLVRDVLKNKTGYLIQEFEFNVPAGNYIARLADHKASVSQVYAKTSTYVSGILSRGQLGSEGVNSNSINSKKEILIRACSGDVDTYNAAEGFFYVYLPWRQYKNGGQDFGRFIEGYVTEDSQDKVPMEMIPYISNHGSGTYKRNGRQTDHNGFYFDMSADGEADQSQVTFYAKINCQTPGPTNASNPSFSTSIPGESRGWFANQNISVKQVLGGFGACNRVLVRGKITDCTSGSALAGVAITLENSPTYYTNTLGEFELIVHPRPYQARIGKIFYNSGGSCSFTACDDQCAPLDDYNDSLVACHSCAVRVYPTVFNKTFKINAFNQRSLKEGGRYGVGIIGIDAAGRANFINNITYKDIPSFLESGKFIPSSLHWSIAPGVQFPSWVKWVSFFVTNNLHNRKYLQWVGDKIDYLDVNGVSTSSGNGAILAKVSIQSLLDYNVSNNFSSVTGYQFQKGDRIRFYDNGSGILFDTASSNGFLDFAIRGTNFSTVSTQAVEGDTEDGKSLLIDYDPRLLALKDKCGFWMEIISPRECTDLELYCETANVYPVVAGEIQGVSSGVLQAFDSYFINRKIIVPGCSGKSFAHPFVSSSISDYWGENCNSCGRTLVKDDKAEQTWYTDDVIRSDDSVNEGRVNGLGTFREQNRKQFKGQQWGGIVAMHAERGIIFFICFNDWFLTDYNQNYVKATAQGLLQANLEGNLSEPHQKVGDNYGCDYADTATIDFYEGLVVWQDVKNDAVLLSDYRSIVDIAAIDNKSYFINKFAHLSAHNQNLASGEEYRKNLFECSGCIDPVSKCYFLTFRKRRNLSVSPAAFVNNEREVFYDMQETIVFDLQAKEWKGFTGFTPEFYARFGRSASGNELVSFAAGGVYFHNSSEGLGSNEFYGVKTEQVLELAFAGEAGDKIFQSITQSSRGAAYLVDSIKTSHPRSFSYLPLPYLKHKAGQYWGSLLRNTNIYPQGQNLRPSNLIDGGIISGRWMKVRLVRDPEKLDVYSELEQVQFRYIPQEKKNNHERSPRNYPPGQSPATRGK